MEARSRRGKVDLFEIECRVGWQTVVGKKAFTLGSAGDLGHDVMKHWVDYMRQEIITQASLVRPRPRLGIPVFDDNAELKRLSRASLYLLIHATVHIDAASVEEAQDIIKDLKLKMTTCHVIRNISVLEQLAEVEIEGETK